MATIILNQEEFEFSFYNRNTTFNDNTITSWATISAIKGQDIINTLNSLANETITSISIKKDNEIVYSLTDLNAKIQSIDESFDGTILNVNLNINFNFNI